MLPPLIVTPILCNLLAASSATMCSCVWPKSIAAQVRIAANRSDVIVAGAVVELRWNVVEHEPGRPDSRMMFRLAVMIPEQTWKGEVGDTLVVWTPDNEGICGYPFLEGERYLVFATRRDSSSVKTGLCTLTQSLAGAERHIRALGAPQHRSAGIHRCHSRDA